MRVVLYLNAGRRPGSGGCSSVQAEEEVENNGCNLSAVSYQDLVQRTQFQGYVPSTKQFVYVV